MSITSYTALKCLLNTLGFDVFYCENISQGPYNIDYGPKASRQLEHGLLPVNQANIIESGKNIPIGKYSSNGISFINDVTFFSKTSLENSISELNEADLLMKCIKIFDWGEVQTSNIEKAFYLHEKGDLAPYLQDIVTWFNNDGEIALPQRPLIWSAGWTKVYSFASNLTTIYDSRCAAFLNYILIKFFYTLPEAKKPELMVLTSKLAVLPGNNDKVRSPNSKTKQDLKLKTYVSDSTALVANKYASWILRYIAEIEFYTQKISQSQFRTLDKAFFMLGFDIKQVAETAELKQWYETVVSDK